MATPKPSSRSPRDMSASPDLESQGVPEIYHAGCGGRMYISSTRYSGRFLYVCVQCSAAMSVKKAQAQWPTKTR